MAGTLLINASLGSLDATLDGFSNDFIYDSPTGSATDNTFAITLPTMIHQFYNSLASTQTQRLVLYMAESLLKGGNVEYKAYDITGKLHKGDLHGAPVWQYALPFTNPVNVATPKAIPEGVACSLSFRRDYGTDVEFVRGPDGKVVSRPRGQDRGRIYVGPLDGNTLQFDASTFRAKFTNVFLNDLLKAFDNISTFSDSSSHVWHLSQWSKIKGSVADIVSTWCDDRPDYQRRRADQSTTVIPGAFSY